MTESLRAFRRNAVHVRTALARLGERGTRVTVDDGRLQHDRQIHQLKDLAIPVRRALNASDRASFAAALAADLDAAIAWYGSVLGFALERKFHIAEVPCDGAMLRRDKFRIELFQVAGAAPLPTDRRIVNRDLYTHGTKHIAVRVPDLDRAVAELRAKGVDFAKEPTRMPNGKCFTFIRDNTGNLIELVQWPND